jgi:hypothetical protein
MIVAVMSSSLCEGTSKERTTAFGAFGFLGPFNGRSDRWDSSFLRAGTCADAEAARSGQAQRRRIAREAS